VLREKRSNAVVDPLLGAEDTSASNEKLRLGCMTRITNSAAANGGSAVCPPTNSQVMFIRAREQASSRGSHFPSTPRSPYVLRLEIMAGCRQGVERWQRSLLSEAMTAWVSVEVVEAMNDETE
jgi:hypothetical protein